MKTVKKAALLCAIAALAAMPATIRAQKKVAIPDIPGYQTLQCDFHIHSVFSDGQVWPTVRVDEAAREGLDAISLSEHIEYRPHHASGDMTSNHNRSHDISVPAAERRDVLLIRGSEITRSMAPGHFNAIFLDDSDALAIEDWRASFAEAKKQGAFIFWNHPGWEAQQRDETRWWPEHTEIYDKGWMHGIEVMNGSLYNPEVHQWAIDKKLTMIGSTDIHAPIQTDYNGEHRTMTLIFARERTPEAIREALDARRTVVYADKLLIGDAPLLRTLLESCVEITDVKAEARRVTVQYRNHSDLTFELRQTAHDPQIDYMHTGQMTIKPREHGTFVIRFPEGKSGSVNFEVTNMLVAPNKGLEVSYDL